VGMGKMSGEEIIENPEGGTAGLTSACQLVDVTDVVGYMNNNTATNIEEIIIVPEIKEGAEISPFGVFKPLERSEKFRKILKRSIEKNRDLLVELSKY
jgi:hypothetical protein